MAQAEAEKPLFSLDCPLGTWRASFLRSCQEFLDHRDERSLASADGRPTFVAMQGVDQSLEATQAIEEALLRDLIDGACCRRMNAEDTVRSLREIDPIREREQTQPVFAVEELRHILQKRPSVLHRVSFYDDKTWLSDDIGRQFVIGPEAEQFGSTVEACFDVLCAEALHCVVQRKIGHAAFRTILMFHGNESCCGMCVEGRTCRVQVVWSPEIILEQIGDDGCRCLPETGIPVSSDAKPVMTSLVRDPWISQKWRNDVVCFVLWRTVIVDECLPVLARLGLERLERCRQVLTVGIVRWDENIDHDGR